MPELINGKGEVIVEDKYKDLTIGLTFPTADVLGKSIIDDQEAEAYSYLVNKFFTSEFIYEQLKAFCVMHFETALKEVKARNNSPLV